MSISENRWKEAQEAEISYWQQMDLAELLRILSEKPQFLKLLDSSSLDALFSGKEVLELGCGPLGIGIASFAPFPMRRFVKVEPLAQIPVDQVDFLQRESYTGLKIWVEHLASMGEYVQGKAEDIPYREEFDTVITYNVLDHVHDPFSILKKAYQALRPGGICMVGVDVRSVVGHFKFEHYTRRVMKDSVLVRAHPFSFMPVHVMKMMRKAGFQSIKVFGQPSLLRRIIGSQWRPAFLGRKP